MNMLLLKHLNCFIFRQSIMITFAVIGLLGSYSQQCKAQVTQLNAFQRDSIIYKTARLIKENYVFKHIGIEISNELLKNQSQGVYKNIYLPDDLIKQLQITILEISKDKHFKISKSGSTNNKDDHEVLSKYGFKKIEVLENNIAYFELDHLPGSKKDLKFAGEVISKHSFCNAIILDVRENIGGSGDLVEYLCNYFFDDTIILYTFHNREGEVIYEAKIQPPDSNKLTNLIDIPIYVLIGPNTHSAAESLAYTLKHFDRATIIGEISAGMAHPSKTYIIDDLVRVTVPFIRFEHPNTGTDWEGIGVIPDIQIELDRNSLVKGVDNQLERALELCGNSK